jgi:hypothetical protein
MKEITIPIKEYIDLLIDSEKLSRLEQGGVDNWEWYSDSLYKFNGDLDEWIEELKKKYK